MFLIALYFRCIIRACCRARSATSDGSSKRENKKKEFWTQKYALFDSLFGVFDV
jgi:hypothetical protein